MLTAVASRLLRSRSLCTKLGNARFSADSERLTPFLFTGAIHYADTPEVVEQWCGEIQKHRPLIGLDSEWKPERRRGENNPIALLQMSFRKEGRPEVLLVHTAFTGVPTGLQDILMDGNIVKVGTDMKTDKAKLKFHFGVEMKGVFDLAYSQNEILRGDESPRKKLGIKYLVAKLLGKKMKKDLTWTRSRWDRRPLQRQQMEYAALDAFGPLAVYEKLKELERRGHPQVLDKSEFSPLDEEGL